MVRLLLVCLALVSAASAQSGFATPKRKTRSTSAAVIKPGQYPVAHLTYVHPTEAFIMLHNAQMMTIAQAMKSVASRPSQLTASVNPLLVHTQSNRPSTLENFPIVLRADAYGNTCDCDWKPGGCVISKPPPSNKACKCKYTYLLGCSGQVVDCKTPLSTACTDPGYGPATCVQGDGNCLGYNQCGCSHAHSGCIITGIAVNNTACHCIKGTFWGCEGQLTYCKDPNSDNCKNPDNSKKSCLQGHGDCNGYTT